MAHIENDNNLNVVKFRMQNPHLIVPQYHSPVGRFVAQKLSSVRLKRMVRKNLKRLNHFIEKTVSEIETQLRDAGKY